MKLYIVVKSTLSAGLAAAQAVHAALLFGATFPHIADYWYHESNNVVVLHEDELETLADQLEEEQFRVARFHEPDLDDALTAICVEPSAGRRLRDLPLAGEKPGVLPAVA